MANDIIPVELIENKIYNLRGQRVMLDSDLAKLYDVSTKILNKAVKRNIERFPEDFMFQVTDNEWEVLRFQFGTSKVSHGGRRYNPYVFTEYGVLMLSNVLVSQKAMSVSIQIIRVFTKLRQMAFNINEIPQRLSELEKLLLLHIEKSDGKFENHQEQINQIIYVLNNLLEKPREPEKVGFRTNE